MTKLYWAPRSLRALWVLEEAGVPYERLRAGEHKSADYCGRFPP